GRVDAPAGRAGRRSGRRALPLFPDQGRPAVLADARAYGGAAGELAGRAPSLPRSGPPARRLRAQPYRLSYRAAPFYPCQQHGTAGAFAREAERGPAPARRLREGVAA